MTSQSSPTEAISSEMVPTDTTEKKDGSIMGKESSDEKSNDDTVQYVTGMKRYTVIGGLTMVAFLMMLDTTIVTTVCTILLPRVIL